MPNDLTKLPKWAQDHIADLQRQRDLAVDTLHTHLDGQTESPLYYEQALCTGKGAPDFTKRYINGTREITFNLGKAPDGREKEVNVRIDHFDPSRLIIAAGWSEVSIIPVVSNVVAIKVNRP